MTGVFWLCSLVVLCRRCGCLYVNRLRTLHFFNNMSGNNGAKAVARIVEASPDLEDLRFSSTRGGVEGGMALAKAVGTLTKLRRLDFNDNTFDASVGEVLADSLGKQKNLEVVNLGDTSTWLLSHCGWIADCLGGRGWPEVSGDW